MEAVEEAPHAGSRSETPSVPTCPQYCSWVLKSTLLRFIFLAYTTTHTHTLVIKGHTFHHSILWRHLDTLTISYVYRVYRPLAICIDHILPRENVKQDFHAPTWIRIWPGSDPAHTLESSVVSFMPGAQPRGSTLNKTVDESLRVKMTHGITFVYKISADTGVQSLNEK